MSLFVSKRVRRRLARIAGASGKLELRTSRAARELAHELGAVELGAASFNALSLLEEAIARLLDPDRHPGLLERAAAAVEAELGRERLDAFLARFEDEFGLADASEPGPAALETSEPEPGRAEPPVEPATIHGRRRGRSGLRPPPARTEAAHRLELLHQLLVFWWLRSNPALAPITELVDDSEFAASEELAAAGRGFRSALAAEPAHDPEAGSLLAELEAALDASPGSPVEQLRFLLPRLAEPAPELEERITAGLDLAAEESAPRFAPGPGPVEPPSWEAAGGEARYSAEEDWMPRAVLVAKNALVWLEQLSRERGEPIARLDEVPTEALADLARQGFNTLWLIGLWERSPASRRIKRLCGNPEAEASAYSVRGYRIARRLGGEEALAGLRVKAAEHGLRLAADIVPNHTGVDSHWVMEHPERFIWEAECPFPNYAFEGPDLAPDSPAAIHIEDHYFDRSDAAVVFRRTDRASGEVRYLYHGNDGTATPWNDTAQLDFLQAEVREAVIEQIIAVAREFSVVRFDAAMTLTRYHFQRLWYPGPGKAGAIPSRAERSLTQERFDELMPEEFWREVVDRVAAEAPDTLLVAEAFWLLEGYFVRVLGMHRVYNSAFMNMLRDGDTAGYRKLLRETLAFDPAMLERFVNFMSNPDEATAAEQFGTGPRYRGVCLLLAMLPGLPMFAHGQVQGFRERYGMEYERSYHDEEPDHALVAWHEELLAPLLARRELFAGGERFELFDLLAADGATDERVIVFANGTAEERVLVAYNHSEHAARGRIRLAAPRAEPGSGGDEPAAEPLLASAPLTAALALDPVRQEHTLRDLLGGGEISVDYRALAEEGLELELEPWQVRLLTPAGETP